MKNIIWALIRTIVFVFLMLFLSGIYSENKALSIIGMLICASLYFMN